MILQLIKEALPEGETLSGSYYEVKQSLKDLGFSYDKIHACQNDCVLFWKENSELDRCPICGVSR